MNIVLTGFMGSGKSVTGKELAKQLNFEFADTDKLIEDSAELSIAEIFAKHGEHVFRQMESEAVEAVSEKDNTVISCGGGAVLNPKNIEFLRKKGIIINLNVSAKYVCERIKDCSSRPLLNNKNPLSEIEKLMKERENAYRNCDYSIDTDGKTPGQVAGEIVKIIDERKINGL
ncbi:MAG: shikimate kinase [Endomicrobia bacterium]|nr:shikimate kinase [Endomicrobiia bacterium]MCL2507306.1 shikimate kinase [Endomicrobiia bacterium]